MRTLAFLFLLCFCPGMPHGHAQTLESVIRQAIGNFRAQVGVAVIVDGKDTVTVNNPCRYPLMSVYKYHQALAVVHHLESNGLPLSTPIHIRKDDLPGGTYSPLRDAHPDGNLSLSVKELLLYTLQQSDNNACDILFRFTGGVLQTDRYLRGLGCAQFSLSKTEEEMHRNPEDCYENWSTPLEAARLVDMLFSRKLFQPANQDFLKNALMECGTGKNRLPKPLLHTTARIGHKTGTSDRNTRNALTGTNDIGFILLPDGRRYAIAVLVKDSEESLPRTESLIASVSEAVYHYLCSGRQ